MLSDHRYTAIFGAALLTAGGATFAVYRMLGTARTPQHESVRSIVVAVRDVPAGVPVPREALGVTSWPARVAPPESFVFADSVVGRITRAPLMPGEPVLASRLAMRGAAPGLEGTIDPMQRAMAVRVNEAASLSGLVRANSRVDVLMAGRSDGSQATARVLMSDVRVLGVGSVRPPEPAANGTAPEPAPSATTAAIVTLEVTPAQAEQLAAAEGQGAIQVVLRGYGSGGNVGGGEGAVNGAGTSVAALDRRPPSAAFAGGAVASAAFAGAPGIGGTSAAPSLASMSLASAPSVRASVGRAMAALHASRTSHNTVHRTSGFGSASHEAGSDAVPRARAESTTVRVYRGGAMTVLRLEATEPATSGASAHEGEPRPVRTADVRTGSRMP